MHFFKKPNQTHPYKVPNIFLGPDPLAQKKKKKCEVFSDLFRIGLHFSKTLPPYKKKKKKKEEEIGLVNHAVRRHCHCPTPTDQPINLVRQGLT